MIEHLRYQGRISIAKVINMIFLSPLALVIFPLVFVGVVFAAATFMASKDNSDDVDIPIAMAIMFCTGVIVQWGLIGTMVA